MMQCLVIFGAALLIWIDDNPPGSVGKYIVYHSRTINGPFTNMMETTQASAALPRLFSGNHYFFVTAVGTNGFESDPSNQVLAPVVAPPQGVKIQITIP